MLCDGQRQRSPGNTSSSAWGVKIGTGLGKGRREEGCVFALRLLEPRSTVCPQQRALGRVICTQFLTSLSPFPCGFRAEELIPCHSMMAAEPLRAALNSEEAE